MPEVRILYSFTESAYQKELIQARSSNSPKYRIASDGMTLLTLSGAIVLKDNEALNLLLQIHELCGHPTKDEMQKRLPSFAFVQRKTALATDAVRKCNFCRCKTNLRLLVSASPVNFQTVKLDINVHYDEGKEERRFEVIAHGVDSKVVDDYVKSTTDILKKNGKWKEPVFSPEASLARSVLRLVDQMRGIEKKEIGNVIEFDPIQNYTVSMKKEQENDMMSDWETESEMGSFVESLVDGESEEEGDEEMIEGEEEESDVEDEELREMRRELAEKERQAEDMENEAGRLADATGRMLAYKRQWEFSDYLHDEIEDRENPQKGAVEEEIAAEKKDDSEEEEEMEEAKESDKENDSACDDEEPSTSNAGLSKEEKKRLANKKKRQAKKKNKKAKTGLEQPPFDIIPYKANYEKVNLPYPDTEHTDQMERVERERKEMQPVISGPVPLDRSGHPERKRGRLAHLRKEKELLEKNTKKEEETKVLPVYNPYAAHFGGNMWSKEDMEKIQRNREERQRRKDAGLTESEEDEEYESD